MYKFIFRTTFLSLAFLTAELANGYTEFNQPCELEEAYRLRIELGPGLHCLEKQVIADSLTRLEKYSFEHMSPQLYEILGIEPSKKGLLSYLEERVQVIVGNGAFTVEATPSAVASRSENSGFHPNFSFLKQKNQKKYDYYLSPDADCAGCDIYARNAFLGLNTVIRAGDSFEKQLDSPNTGLIDIKAGFFYPTKLVNPYDQFAEINQIYRIAIYFHEARHHDAHEEFNAFLHPICPTDHHLSGFRACDYTPDGPYTVGGLIFDALVKECRSCSKLDLKNAELFQKEKKSRVIPRSKRGSVLKVQKMNYEKCIQTEGALSKRSIINRWYRDLERVLQGFVVEGFDHVDRMAAFNPVVEKNDFYLDLMNAGCNSQNLSDDQRKLCTQSTYLDALTDFLADPRFSDIESACRILTRILPD